MLKPDFAFSFANLIAILSWLGLAGSLFVPATYRPLTWTITAAVVPALLGLAYAVLLAAGVRAGAGGGFGSIAAVRQLFANDAALAAGWLHYLAFDLFVGTWIARTGTAAALSPFLLLPCLALTFLIGPVGLLVFLVLRLLLAPALASAI